MKSHPTWVRGLKLADEDATLRVLVAPYVSAWIETLHAQRSESRSWSHPTWVRGLKPYTLNAQSLGVESHPTWVRGLKHPVGLLSFTRSQSHPTWVRGLKPQVLEDCLSCQVSHPTWVRGLKHHLPR